jgi:hypothetical protein
MLNQLEKIAVKTTAAVAFAAHYSKGNQSLKESIDRIGGSGVFARDPDSILTMTAHAEEECFTVNATLRNFPPIEPFVVRWKWPLFTRDEELDPEQLKQAKTAKSGQYTVKYTDDMLLDELSLVCGVRTVELRKLMEDRYGMKKTEFYRRKSRLIKDKQIIERPGENGDELFRASQDDNE